MMLKRKMHFFDENLSFEIYTFLILKCKLELYMNSRKIDTTLNILDTKILSTSLYPSFIEMQKFRGKITFNLKIY